MPKSKQIGYRVAIKPATEAAAGAKSSSYDAEFTLNVDDLKMNANPDGTRSDTLVAGLTVYDRY